MALLNLINVDYSIGGPLLLEQVNFSVEPGERIAIVGRNGAGKSTLMKLLAGEILPDDGQVQTQVGLKVARLTQEIPTGTSGSIFDVVAAALGEIGGLLADYHHVSHAPTVDTDELARLHGRIDELNGWSMEQRVSQVLTRLGLPEDVEFASLSGGMKRRVGLAQALVTAPDVLLLDEPTNHLDIESIAWLEDSMRSFAGTLVFVTHDRQFLRALATRIIEIDRGQLTSWPGDYANYLRRCEERAHAEAQENALFDKKLAAEEVWIRQGIKARRTRNEGRVTALKALRRERAERRERVGNIRLEMPEAQASGKQVIKIENAGFTFGERVLLRDFTTTILRGDRIGIIGPNGSGKTTLLRVILGELEPTSGSVRRGTQLEIAYFDQQRAQLRDDWNALDNVAEGREYIELGDSRKHVLGYLQDFLFTPERARAPITRLSGGERNRLLLAKLFAQPSNLLVLDEPTNDLDVETLELLEERLDAYAGTVLLVSHDRAFLDAVATSTLVLEGDGMVGDYVGGYSDWERQRPTKSSAGSAASNARKLTDIAPKAVEPAATPAPPARRKLSYKEQRELDGLPLRIEQLETDIAELTAAMHTPDFYRRGANEIVAANARMATLQSDLATAYERWQALEATI